jgi:zinc protease
MPRLFILWHTPPTYAPGDAELDMVSSILAGGKNSRLYKRLVYDLQVAQNVSASQNSAPLGSMYLIDIVARPSTDPPALALDKLKAIVDEELAHLREEPPDARELERAVNQAEASFYTRMERVGGFGGKADQLNGYFVATGNPDFFNEDLSRYLALEPSDIQAAVRRWLVADRRVEIAVVPAASSGK